MTQANTPAACPVCASNQLHKALTCKDYTVSKEEFDIWECAACTLRFTYPVPGEDSIGPYYQSDAYISHSDSGKGLINSLYKKARTYTLQWKLKLVQKESSLQTGRLLDIGAGTGAFLNTIKDAGWNGSGLEPDAGARKVAKDNYGLELQSPELLFALPKNQFDVITMWHVLEHVHRLHEYIEQIKQVLKPQGVALIAVPNYTSKDARHYKQFWAAYDVPRHLYHFSPKAIRMLVQAHGLKVADTVPMKLDAFYIAMLSEQYKNGKGNLPAALWNGLQSNLYGAMHKEAYSSLVYVLR